MSAAMSAGIYARFSTSKQREASIDDQARNCRVYAERRGWTILEDCIFVDRAVSGSLSDRPGYNAMQQAAKAGRFDVLIVDDLSRLARDAAETQTLHKRLRFWDVGLVAVSDGIDTTQNAQSSGLIMGVKGAMNEEYLRDLAEKTRRGLAGRASAGLSPGGLPYGYTSEPVYSDPPQLDRHGKPIPIGYRRVVVPEEAEVVRRIFRLAAQGELPQHPGPLSPKQIVRVLNGDRLPSPGERWSKREVRKGWSFSAIQGDRKRGIGILNNEGYLGRIIWNRFEWRVDPDAPRTANGHKRRVPRLRPRCEWVVTEVPELRIVTDELWEAVKQRQAESAALRERRNLRPANRGVHLLTGFVKCGVCGAQLVMVGKTSYGCATRAYRSPDLCASERTVNKEALEVTVLQALKDRIYADDGEAMRELTGFAEEALKGLLAGKRQTRDGVDGLRGAQRRTEAEIQGLLSAIKAGVVTRTTQAELLRLEDHQDALQRQIEDAGNGDQREPRLVAAIRNLPQRVRHYVDDLSELLKAGQVARVKCALEPLLEEVTVTPGRTKDNRPCHIVRLRGDLSGIARLLPNNAKTVVAGARFETFNKLLATATAFRLVYMAGVRGRRACCILSA